jgi:primosomal protein N' (replication factor Y) (superfamily II helicase)
MIVKIAIDVPLFKLFDYRWDLEILRRRPAVGQIVKVEFGKKMTTGIVLQINENSSSSNDQIKTLKDVLQVAPLIEMDPALLRVCLFSAKYYLRPIGEILFSSIPTEWKKPERWQSLEKQKEKHLNKKNSEKNNESHIWNLNKDQKEALEYLKKISQSNRFDVTLLKGITGSGKTAVYLEWIKTVLQDDKSQCLIMVPEINLTPQLEKIIKEVFLNEEIEILHSNITPAKRNIAWWKIQNGISRVIVGTRLSIFAPIPHLKAIVVDEEHDYSYKQQDGLRYNARDLAIWRAADCKIPIVLITATPSSETWQKVEQKKIQILQLNQKAKFGATEADVRIIDLVQAKKNKQLDEAGLTQEIKEVIKQTWFNKKQSLIFINRRGYSPILHCASCAWKSQCKKCSAFMVVHKKRNNQVSFQLQCHHCGTTQAPPRSCPNCGNQDLKTIGMGTQKIEEYLQSEFPEIKMIRIDSDSTKSKGGADLLFNEVHSGLPCLIVGTQMVSKGHDFQHIQSVIVLDADKSLYSQDFRSVEKLFSQLVQVAGRGGRSNQTEGSKVYIQTEFKEHPLFEALKNKQYDQFFTQTLKERKENNLPPYIYQALIIVESKNAEKNIQILLEIKEYLRKKITKKIEISDPFPRTLHKLSGIERDQILIESVDRQELQEVLEKALDLIEEIKKESRAIKINIDRDPILY